MVGSPNLPYKCRRKAAEKYARTLIAVGMNNGGPGRSIRVQVLHDRRRLEIIQERCRWRKGSSNMGTCSRDSKDRHSRGHGLAPLHACFDHVQWECGYPTGFKEHRIIADSVTSKKRTYQHLLHHQQITAQAMRVSLFRSRPGQILLTHQKNLGKL